MPLALYYKTSYERLQDQIRACAPELDVALIDDHGEIELHGKKVALDDIAPEYFWIHGELFKSPLLKEYFRIMQTCESIRWLHTINTGLDGLPYLPLVEKGVQVTNNHAQAIAIAEYVLGQVLGRYQRTVDFHASQQAGLWRQRSFREIHGTQWLMVGFGHIGKAVSQRVRAFGASVTAVRRNQDTEGLADRVITQSELGAALANADVVVLACASTAQTRGMVDANFLAAMKPNSILVNVARGDLVVEDDLQAALDSGKPACAILDVLAREPPASDYWVWQHPSVILTPHTSNAGSGMQARSVENFLNNLGCITKGLPLQNLVSRDDIV